jgi:hypothetical protein
MQTVFRSIAVRSSETASYFAYRLGGGVSRSYPHPDPRRRPSRAGWHPCQPEGVHGLLPDRSNSGQVALTEPLEPGYTNEEAIKAVQERPKRLYGVPLEDKSSGVNRATKAEPTERPQTSKLEKH